MPTETGRTTHMVRVTNPNNSSQYVDIKCIDQISFIDLHSYAQETRFTVDNSKDNNSRKVRVQRITSTVDPSNYVDVERVLTWNVIDQHSYAQETDTGMTGDQQEPPTHFKTHVFVIFSPDQLNWIKVQRIDQLQLVDQHDYAQETDYYLRWVDDDMTNPSDLDTSSDGSQINPPWRLDPFQEIVDVSWASGGGGHPIYPPLIPTGFTGNFNFMTPAEVGKVVDAGKNPNGVATVVLNPPVDGLYTYSVFVDGVLVTGSPYVPGSSPFNGGWFDGMTGHDARPAAQGGTVHPGFTSDGFFWNGNAPGTYPCPGPGNYPADCNPGPY